MRDPGGTPEFADLASASSQSTHPLSRICQVLLSMMRWRQKVSPGETTSKDPVLRSASPDGRVRATRLIDACQWLAMRTAVRQKPNAIPQATTARRSSPASRPAADGLRNRKLPVALMVSPLVARGMTKAGLHRMIVAGNHCSIVIEDGKGTVSFPRVPVSSRADTGLEIGKLERVGHRVYLIAVREITVY